MKKSRFRFQKQLNALLKIVCTSDIISGSLPNVIAVNNQFGSVFVYRVHKSGVNFEYDNRVL